MLSVDTFDAVGSSLELADAMHLVRAPEDSEFVTFDRALARAGKIRPTRIV
ncbi:MAG TPA: hypothetical protein VGA44_00445 [Steroidobacteraceae bacterium]